MLITSALLGLCLIYAGIYVQRFLSVLRVAKKSRIPWIFVPFPIDSTLWQATQGLLLPVLEKLPTKWTQTWIPLTVWIRAWSGAYRPFRIVGHDTFITVSPTRNTLWTCDPSVIEQLSSRRYDYPKPVHMLSRLNIYGPTVTATEGSESRLYRKITAPSFNERTMRLCWRHSILSTENLIQSWIKAPKSGVLHRVQDEMARLGLHVISFTCFGKEMRWNHTHDDMEARQDTAEHHTMSYEEAIKTLLDNILTLMVLPDFLLRFSPFRQHRHARQSFKEWLTYMEEMRDAKQHELRKAGAAQSDPNLLGALVQASSFPGRRKSSDAQEKLISSSAVLGNMFIFILAGHETSANALAFAVTCLACKPWIQRRLQEQLDAIFTNRPDFESWSYTHDFPALSSGVLGAVLNETLRVFTVLPFIPKMTAPGSPQPLKIDGTTFIVPEDCLVLINTSATHRNPKYWSERQNLPGEDHFNPVASFDIDKWLVPNPVKTHGAYIPLAEGPRACLGDRFAKVEFVAVLARLFKCFSVELVVQGEGTKPTKAELHQPNEMTDETDRARWRKARQNAERELSQKVELEIALKIKDGVALRLVPRGQERWSNMSDIY